MGCRLEWRLLGREGRFLDSGEIDDDFPDRGCSSASARRTPAAFLRVGAQRQ